MAKQFTIDQLAALTPSGGFQRANQREMVNILANKMREIYGNDIDLSDASADAQYIMMESLILNNIYSVLGNTAANLNPNTAVGQYLDILCQLTNVKRKAASASRANIYIKNVSGSSITLTPNDTIEVVDTNNIKWTYTPVRNITIGNNNITLQTFICTELGPVKAYGTGVTITDPINDIPWNSADFTINNGSFRLVTYGSYKIYQAENAIIGNIDEDDSSLRARQRLGSSINSYTTLDGLIAALYNLPYIEDAYAYNNVTSGTYTDLNDGVGVLQHNVYIALRYKKYIVIDDNEIAQVILNRMTPGVLTQDATGTTSGTAKSATIDGTTINWKKCAPVHPQIKCKFMCINNYDKTDALLLHGQETYTLVGCEATYWVWESNETSYYTHPYPDYLNGTGKIYSDSSLTDEVDEADDYPYNESTKLTEQESYIKSIVLEYLNNIQIEEKLQNSDILSILNTSDLMPGGRSSIIPAEVSITGQTDPYYYLAPVTYYDYGDCYFAYDGNYCYMGIVKS